MKAVVLTLTLLFAGPRAWADTAGDAPVVPGTRAENMLVLPSWIMDECGPSKSLKATYDFEGAKALKVQDNQCNLWRLNVQELAAQVDSYKRTMAAYKNIIESFEQTRGADRAFEASLLASLNTEIAQKNKYKYQPSYGWLYGVAGAVIGVIGVAYGLGAAH